MNYTDYNRFADTIRSHRVLMTVIQVCNVLFTAVGFIMYPVLLIRLWLQGNKRSMALHVLIPGMTFVLLSLYREVRNAPRPYEIHPIRPLIRKGKKGRSFPSRHIFSIMLIGVLWLASSPLTACIILICGIGLAWIRVIGGIHFIKDVFLGTVLGILAGILTLVLTLIP